MMAFTSQSLPSMRAASLLVALGAVFPLGCSVSSANDARTKVWGRITVDGKPLEGGLIVFWSTDPAKPNWGAGPINNRGEYELTAYATGRSLAPGKYQVQIKPAEENARPPRGVRGEKESDLASESRSESDQEPAPAKPVFPTRFQNPNTSGLEITLGKEPTRVDFELTDRPE